MTTSGSPARTFADKLDFLCRHRHRSSRELAQALAESGIPGVSTDWVAQLRAGTRAPSVEVERALTAVLEVPDGYFADEDVAVVDAVLVLGAALRDRGVHLHGPCRWHARDLDRLSLYAAVLGANA